MVHRLVIIIKNQSNFQVIHSVDSFLALAAPFVSLTFISLALWTILSLSIRKNIRNQLRNRTSGYELEKLSFRKTALTSKINTLYSISTYLLAAERLLAISPQKTLLFMRSKSRSLSLVIRNFLNPLARKCLVFLSCLLPIFISFWVPLNLLLVKQSIPLTLLWEG